MRAPWWHLYDHIAVQSVKDLKKPILPFLFRDLQKLNVCRGATPLLRRSRVSDWSFRGPLLGPVGGTQRSPHCYYICCVAEPSAAPLTCAAAAHPLFVLHVLESCLAHAHVSSPRQPASRTFIQRAVVLVVVASGKAATARSCAAAADECVVNEQPSAHHSFMRWRFSRKVAEERVARNEDLAPPPPHPPHTPPITARSAAHCRGASGRATPCSARFWWGAGLPLTSRRPRP